MILADHSNKVYSQSGEDGIIKTIFEIIGTSSKLCIEFGAWDGILNSNTANLWRNGWKGILIEADKIKYEALVRNAAGYDCYCIHAFVSHTGENTLENILRRQDLLREVDFLSIDIDGNDYFVFESLSELRPRLIACEYNPTIPYHLELVPEPENFFGCSILSLVRLAESKAYRLVALTETNAFFVRDDDYVRFSEYDTSLPSLALTKHITYLITGYSGDYIASREPTYGCTGPSTQRFLTGSYYRLPQPSRLSTVWRSLIRLIHS